MYRKNSRQYRKLKNNSRSSYRQFSLDFMGQRSSYQRTEDSGTVLDPKKRRMRTCIFGILAVLWIGIIGSRLYYLQILEGQRWKTFALKQHVTDIELASERGPILDRDGKLLAVSVPAGSVYVRPKQVKNKEETARKLAAVLQMDPRDITSKLNESKPFVWVRRQLPRSIADNVANLEIPGVSYVLEAKRFYPYNNAASTLIGKVGIDGNGLSGIEKIYEQKLHEQNKKERVIRDAYGNSIHLAGLQSEQLELPKGSSLQLTLDTAIQQIADEETELGQSNSNAKTVASVMIDADTGEILAMSQSDSPNFNTATANSAEHMKNKLVEAVFEPGSIFKPLVAAGAIEDGVVKASEIINCENGRFPFQRHVIKDVHGSGAISFFDVVVRSSNIGMTKVGVRLGKERLYEWIRKFGFGYNTDLGLPGETPGILRHVKTWSGVDVATHSFGQGVAVTPLQMVRGVAPIVNGGKLPTLKLVKDENDDSDSAKRIISQETAKTVLEMMYGVVENDHGTGAKAEIAGLRVGGKTGTAQKARPDGKGYQAGAYVASFVGFVDTAELGLDRKLVLAVMVDEPKTTSIYGGTLAAPVFRRIMQRSVHSLLTRNQIGEKTPQKESNPLFTNIALRS